MATYARLLAGTGGGIINRHQQSERQADANICIGIGGTGSDALRKLKREVYRKLKPDNPDSPIPTYKNIKFLVIDSDSSKWGTKAELSELQKDTEYFDISNKDITTAFRAKKILDNRPEMAWLNKDKITIKTANDGAGGNRQVGRFLLLDKAALFKAKLNTVITEAITGVKGDVNIHIFSGLSGGTGSGCLIDVCYIVRHVLNGMGRGNARISAYLFMPDVNLCVPQVAGDPLISSYVRVNGYAALKELDYLMSLEAGKDFFTQSYGTFDVNMQVAPVDMCYLISSTNTAGRLVEDGYNYGLSVAVDYVISFLSKVTLPEGVAAGNDDGGQTLKGHIANLEAAKAGIKKRHGACLDYNIIGAANAEMPLSEIATYLAAKLFDRFDFMYDKMPSENHLAELISKNQLSYEQITSALTKGIAFSVNFPNFDPQTIQAGNKPAIDRADQWIASARGKLQENRTAMIEKLKDFKIPDKPASLIGKLYQGLYNGYASNPQFGPFFAMRMLGGKSNKNMIHIIDGYIEKNESLLAAENRQTQLREDKLEEEWRELRHAGWLNRGHRLTQYLQALNNQYVHLAKIEQYTYLAGLLKEWRKQVVDLNNNFFDVLTAVLDTLKFTFKENADILTQGIRTENTYTWHILSISDIRDNLDDQVNSLDVEQTLKNFIVELFQKYPEWLGQDVNKITLLVSDFVIQQFREITQRTILDYLRVKFGTDDPVLLVNRIETNILQEKLDVNAEPLFWVSNLFQLGEISKNSTLSVPYDATEIVKAAQQFVEGHEKFAIRQTSLTDRIFMMRFYSGVPLYAYQGLQELEKAYEADNTAGRHLYEQGGVDWNQYLPSPIPNSFEIPEHKIARIQTRNKNLLNEFETAKQEGIVVNEPNTNNWYVMQTEALPKDLLPTPDTLKTNDMMALMDKKEAIEDALQKFHDSEHVTQVSISLAGADASAIQIVLEDNYLKFSAIQKMVHEELEKLDRMRKAVAQLDAAIDGLGDEEKVKNDFFNALFTGVFHVSVSKITYDYDDFGIPETLDLQNNKMPFAKCAIYQAFLTYQELSPELRAQIADEATDKLDKLDEDKTILEAAQNLQKKYKPDFLKAILNGVARSKELKEIRAFYQDFMQRLKNYIQLYC